MAYCTPSDVRDYGDIESAADDGLILDLITRAQAIIDERIGFSFEASANTSRVFDAVEDTDGPILYFDTWCASIDSVTNGDSTTVTSSQYVTIPQNTTPIYGIKIRSDQSIYWTYSTYHEGAITVSAKWAYSTSAPDDIKQACIRLATFLYRQRDSSSDFDRPVIVEGAITILPGKLPADVAEIIESYRVRTRFLGGN